MTTSSDSYNVELGGTQLRARSGEDGICFDGEQTPVPILDGDRLRSFVGLLRDGLDTPIYVEQGDEPDEFIVFVRGEVIPVTLRNGRAERLQALRKSAVGSRSTAQLVSAPMPGMLKEILVVEGQVVAKGETLCILEAMKMENEIKSPARFVVKRLIIAAGTAVEKGAPLLELQPEG